MPTTVTSSKGTTFHLFQIPEAVKELDTSVGVAEIRNDLGDGYSSERLTGSITGNRSWTITLPTLDTGRTTTGPDGEVGLTWEQYIWALFMKSKATGKAFAYADPRNSQIYLAKFADSRLNYRRVYASLYSTGLNIVQHREDGETVLDVSKTMGSYVDRSLEWLKGSGFSGSTWTAANGDNLAATGDVVKVSASQNGHDIVRFNNTSNTGYVTGVASTVNKAREIFIVMKMREATFSNNAGVISTGTSTSILRGSSGTTKFANLGFGTGYEYRLNGVLYAESDQQAPMNEWGIVHLRRSTLWDLSDFLQIGRDRTTAGTYAELDAGEVIVATGLLSAETYNEVVEHLAVKWNV